MTEAEDNDGRPAGLPEHERVYRALRQRILGGAMGPGDAVTLRGLAEDFGVSITPAREAVRRLVAERALTMSASGRVALPTPDAATVQDLFRARLLLEPELAGRAAASLGPAAVVRLREADATLRRHLAAGDVAGYVRANTEFHSLIYERADAPALLALVHSVWLQSVPLMHRVFPLIDLTTLDNYHAAAMDAASAGDARALSQAIRDDVAQGARLLTRARLDEAGL